MKENGEGNLWKRRVMITTSWVVTIKISGRPPLESFILIEIRPRERR